MPSNHLILCHPLFFLPSIFPSIRVLSNESALRIRWPKDWSFSFSISPSNEHPGLISFTMDWLDLLTVQGTLKSLLQHHSSKASILRCSAFFIAQLSHPHMTTGKTTALTRWTFVSKVMSLLFNMLPRLVIAFLLRSKCLLISWLQSPSAVILEPRKIKSCLLATLHDLFWAPRSCRVASKQVYTRASTSNFLLRHRVTGCQMVWMVKNPPLMQDPQVRPLGQEDPLRKGLATHSGLLAWKNVMDRGTW